MNQFSKFALVVVLSASLGSCAVVNSGEVGISSSFGTVKPEPLQPGLHFWFPGLANVSTLSVRTQAPPEEFTALTVDSQKIVVTAISTYALNPANAPKAYTQVGTDVDTIAKVVVRPVLLSAVKNVVSRYQMSFIIENQTKISQEIQEEIEKRLGQASYVSFQDFNVTGFVLDPNVQDSVEKKQIAVQELQRKQTELQTAKIEAQRLDALNRSLTPNILLQQAIQKWNGNSAVPPGSGGNGFSLLVQPASGASAPASAPTAAATPAP